MNRVARCLVLSLVVLAAGCAATPPPRQESGSPRVRCLVDPKREPGDGTRPLFFLFCIESP